MRSAVMMHLHYWAGTSDVARSINETQHAKGAISTIPRGRGLPAGDRQMGRACLLWPAGLKGPLMTRLILIRHGEADDDADDPELSDRGRRQVAALADRLRGQTF